MSQLPTPPDIHALLKRIEWSGYSGIDCCPECGADKYGDQHRKGCELAAAIEWTKPHAGFTATTSSNRISDALTQVIV